MSRPRILMLILVLFLAGCSEEIKEPITSDNGLIFKLLDGNKIFDSRDSICLYGKIDTSEYQTQQKLYLAINVPRWYGEPKIQLEGQDLPLSKSQYLDLGHHDFHGCFYGKQGLAHFKVKAEKETAITQEEWSMGSMLTGYLRIKLSEYEHIESSPYTQPECIKIE